VSRNLLRSPAAEAGVAADDLVLAALALAVLRCNDAEEASVSAGGRRIELAEGDALTVRELLQFVAENAAPDAAPTAFTRAQLRMAARLRRELARDRGAGSVGELDGVGDRERELVVRTFNDVPRPPAGAPWIAEAFASQVRRTPDAIAISGGGEQITFAELDALTATLSRRLRDAGAEPGRVVAVIADRSIELVVAIVAILRSGAAFLPIGTDDPPARVERKLRETAAVATVDEALGVSAGPAPGIAGPEDLAYVLYTSGSTGEPKGAMLRQQALANLCAWYRDAYAIDGATNVLLMIPATFDASLKNILTPLITGGRLVLAPARYNPFEILELIEREEIAILNCSPSAIYPLVQLAARDGYRRLASLRALALGGEATHLPPLRDWLLRDDCRCVLSNLYGPAECTDLSIGGPIDRETIRTADAPPLGRPIVDAEIRILDRHGRLQPRGAIGEIVIRGPGVGDGYAARPDLTAAVFVDGTYHSGDYGWWRDDRQIAFAGRRDHQIKLRGRRIDLGEIERQLLAVAGVQQAAVIRHDTTLRAFYSGPADPSTLATRLRETLPEWMVPLSFTRRETIPLNANGKIDRRALGD
jgi:non-ribosomal peptide synthetase component F